MCNCYNIDFTKQHSYQTFLKIPIQNIPDDFLFDEVMIDNCLIDEIKELWSKGVITITCCCGHNKVAGFIAVIKNHWKMMEMLGYEKFKNIHWNSSWPEGGEFHFKPRMI